MRLRVASSVREPASPAREPVPARVAFARSDRRGASSRGWIDGRVVSAVVVPHAAMRSPCESAPHVRSSSAW
jgi:hypothetical protein